MAKKKKPWLITKDVKFDVRPYWPFVLMGGVVTIAVWLTMRKLRDTATSVGDAATSIKDTTRDVQSLVAVFKKGPATVSTSIVGYDPDLDPNT
jgi:hypothetical protein